MVLLSVVSTFFLLSHLTNSVVDLVAVNEEVCLNGGTVLPAVWYS